MHKKIKIGVIFGGKSSEHNISVISGKNIIDSLNKNKYDIFPIYIDNNGIWYANNNKIKNIIQYLKKLDIVFPILHGKYGEDGSIQGLFEMFDIKYIGCNILSSSIAMDKVYAKKIFDIANIKNAKSVFIKKSNNNYIFVKDNFDEKNCNLDEAIELIIEKLTFPMFIKPSNSGSSIGINKAKNKKELKEYIEYASNYDYKILIEEEVIGKEIECAVLGNNEISTSCLGEIVYNEDFYSYDSKYVNDSKLIIPASLNTVLEKKVKETAIKAYNALSCEGLARVDFFVNDFTDEIYINEINTLPGFTHISMYPKLWENSGLKVSDLLDKLIEISLSKKSKN